MTYKDSNGVTYVEECFTCRDAAGNLQEVSSCYSYSEDSYRGAKNPFRYFKKGVKFAFAFLAAVVGGVIGCLIGDITGFIIGAIAITAVRIIISRFAKKHPKIFKGITIAVVGGVCLLVVLPML